MYLKYDSIEELVRAADEAGCRISGLVLREQAAELEKTEEALFSRMEQSFEVMMEACEKGRKQEFRSMSGLTGGEGRKMSLYAERTGGGICGPFVTGAMARALAVSNTNASMGRIVAAPTAGSCGILPGCLVSMVEDRGVSKRDAVMACFTAGAFGMVIAKKASISGAEGGCQAECGSAAGMAAAALTELMGGSPEQCGHALAIALVSQMGLVCDPVAGLVEIPCIKRNASGVVLAMSSADLALAGVAPYIPADECIAAMREVGCALPAALRETAAGGLASTPTGKRLREQVFGTNAEKAASLCYNKI